MYLPILRVNFKKSAKDLSKDACVMFLSVFFSSDFLYKRVCCGYSFELHRQVDAIQMGTTTYGFIKK